MTKTYGQIAYEAYCRSTGGKSLISGVALPEYTALKHDIRKAWEEAAGAVLTSVSGGPKPGTVLLMDEPPPPEKPGGQGPEGE